MADDPWKRFRDRNLKKNETNVVTLKQRRQNIASGAPKAEPVDELTQHLEQVPMLLEQLGHLYNMYMSGIERRPPVEKRKHLEHVIAKIQAAPKATSSIRFKCSAVVQQAQAHFERWDKLLRKLETGAAKRRAGER